MLKFQTTPRATQRGSRVQTLRQKYRTSPGRQIGRQAGDRRADLISNPRRDTVNVSAKTRRSHFLDISLLQAYRICKDPTMKADPLAMRQLWPQTTTSTVTILRFYRFRSKTNSSLSPTIIRSKVISHGYYYCRPRYCRTYSCWLKRCRSKCCRH